MKTMTTQKELLELADFMAQKEEITPVKIIFKDIKGEGRAHYRYRWITMPNWIFRDKYCDEYRYWYMLHEMCHIILFDRGYHGSHGEKFKEIEKKYLNMFGLEVEYKKAYPKRLYSNGVVFYESKPKRRIRRYSVSYNGSQH